MITQPSEFSEPWLPCTIGFAVVSIFAHQPQCLLAKDLTLCSLSNYALWLKRLHKR